MTNSTQPSTLARGYPIALASAVFLSTTAILIRYLTVTYALPALVLAFWRAVFVALTLLVFFALFQRPMLGVEKRHLPYLVIYGFVLALFNSFWTLSVAENGAAVATVLVYCSAAFTALLGWWLLKERLDRIKLLVVALSLGGCVLVSEALDPAIWRMNAFGITTGVLAGLLYAVYTLMGRSASQRGLKPWSALLYIFAFDAVFLLLFNLLFGRVLPGGARQIADLFWLGNAWAGWGVLLVLAAVPTVAGFGLYNVSLVYLPSSVTNLVVTSEPVFTAVFAYFLLGERLNAVQIGGSLLIMAGVVILRIHEGRMARIKLKMTKVEE
ncbi:MAG: DMT family transporter [Anaerolineaceae bacterium]|jgi:drug/metabolite transporter (DMT)-like permease|nr:DMT family transporter [Anaerolineaceae bacterium]